MTKTTLQSKVEKLDNLVLEAGAKCEAVKARLLAEIVQAEQARDREIETLRAERDALVLEEKLKEFPKELVKTHTHCSVCGADMYPFKYAEGEQVKRAWACVVGSLQPDHDLVPVM